MPGIERTPDEIVTDHAALRFLQRVLEVDIGTIKPQGESKRLAAICAGFRISPTAFKAGMLTPPVRAALAAGAGRILHCGFWIVFDSRRVVTVIPKEARWHLRNSGRGHRFGPGRYARSPQTEDWPE